MTKLILNSVLWNVKAVSTEDRSEFLSLTKTLQDTTKLLEESNNAVKKLQHEKSLIAISLEESTKVMEQLKQEATVLRNFCHFKTPATFMEGDDEQNQVNLDELTQPYISNVQSQQIHHLFAAQPKPDVLSQQPFD